MRNLGKSKKLAAAFLAVMMTIGLFAMPAFATGNEVEQDSTSVVESVESTATEDVEPPQDSSLPLPESSTPVQENSEQDSSEEAGALEESTWDAADTQAMNEGDGLARWAGAPVPFATVDWSAITELSKPRLAVDDTPYNADEPITITGNSTITLRYTWKIQDGKSTSAIKAGDYAILGNLPAGLPFASDLTKLSPIEVSVNPGNIVVGYITFEAVNATGMAHRIVLTFASGITSLTEVEGEFSLESRVNFSQVQVPGDVVDVVMKDDGTFVFSSASVDPVDISKSFAQATLNGAPNTNKFDTLEWTIDVNTSLQDLKNATVTDVVSVNRGMAGLHTLANARVEVYNLTVKAGSAGKVQLELGTKVDESKYTVTKSADNQLVIALGNIGAAAYRIVIKSDVSFDKLHNMDWDAFTFQNKATVTADGGHEASDTAQFVYSTGAQNTKDANTPYIEGGYYLTQWNIFINRLNLDYGAAGENVTLQDILPEGLEFMDRYNQGVPDFRLFTLTYDSETGKEVRSDGPVYTFAGNDTSGLSDYFTVYPYLSTTDRTNDTANFTFKTLNNIGYLLVIYTEIDEEVFARGALTNYMEYEIEGYAKISDSAKITPSAANSKVTLAKKGLTELMTYDTFDWRITYTVKDSNTAENVVIYDTFRTYDDIVQELIEESLAVTVGGMELDSDEYTLEAVEGSYKTGFQIRIHGAVTETVVVTYKTRYTLKNASSGAEEGARRGGTAYNDVIATANINGDTEPTERTATDHQNIPSQYTINGLKSGVYDLDTDYITWTVDVNYRRVDLGDVVELIDQFGDNQAYDGSLDDLQIYEIVDGARVRKLERDVDYIVKQSPVGSRTGFTVEFQQMGTSHYQLEYKTGVVDTSVPLGAYTNKCTVTCLSKTGHPKYSFQAEVTKPGSTGVLSKTAKKDEKDSDLYHWTMMLNKNEDALVGAVLTDHMSRGLVLVEGSIELNTKSGEYRELKEDVDYTLTINEASGGVSYTEFIIEFIGEKCDPLTQFVELTYSTRLDASTAKPDINNQNSGNYIVSNEAKLTAGLVTSWTTVSESTFITTGSGSASGKNQALLTINKVDDKNGRTLPGAEFRLLNEDKSIALDNIVIGSGGSITVQVEKGKYILEETKAPEGYVLPDDPYTPIDLTGDGSVSVEKTIKNTEAPEEPNAPPTKTALEVNGEAVESETTVSVGDKVRYRITYDAPVGTDTITVEDILPDGVKVVSAKPAGGYKNDNYVWQIDAGSEENTGWVEITIEVLEVYSSPKTLLNKARVSYDGKPDPEEPWVELPYEPKEPDPEPETTTPSPSVSNPDPSNPEPSDPPPASTSSEPYVPPVDPTTSASTTSRAVSSRSSRSSSSSSSSSASSSSSSSEADGGVTSEPAGGGTANGGEATPTLEGEIVPNDGENTQELSLAGVPLGGFSTGNAWSLLNLLMSVISLLAGLVLFVGLLRRRKNAQQEEEEQDEFASSEENVEDDEQEKQRRRRFTALRLPAIILSLLPGILFLILEDIRLPMTWITRWTPIIGAAFIIHMVVLLVFLAITKREKEDEPDEADGQPA